MIRSIKLPVLISIFSAFSFASFAQGTSKKEEINNWYQLDKAETGYYGISLNKAYQFVKGKKSKTVLVAVIDSGVDTAHEDPVSYTHLRAHETRHDLVC